MAGVTSQHTEKFSWSHFLTQDRSLICVQGLGFVGLAMATVVANSFDDQGQPLYNVIGVDLPQNQPRIDFINQGKLPFESEDHTFAPELRQAVKENANFIATTDERVYQYADIVIVDVNLDIEKLSPDDYSHYSLQDEPFRRAIATVGRWVKPECLILIETTVPPGFCRHVIYPILQEEFDRRGLTSRPLLAHSYERVMPGKEYLRSIRHYYRVYSGMTPEAARRAREFLESIIDTRNYPLTEASTPEASELGKVLENTFRATNIALIYEWTLIAEKAGVNLFAVIEAIKKRKTHNNIMKPGFGVGGYCLTKDSLLALWSADRLFSTGFGLPMSKMALEINDKMPLHTLDIIREETALDGKRLALLGISYREDVGDTRNSPSEVFYRALQPYNIRGAVHDPYVKKWEAFPEVQFIEDLHELKEMDIVVLAVRHRHYLEMSAQDWLAHTQPGTLVVDANNILDDEKILELLKAKRNVIGVGKGHIQHMKEAIGWQKS